MVRANYISQETNLVGEIINRNVAATDLEIQVRFFDNKTGEAREPNATTLQFVINKDATNFEIIKADSHVTVDGITTITINANGRNLPLTDIGNGSNEGRAHSIGDSVGCVYTHNQLEETNSVLRGEKSTNATSFTVGNEEDNDITLFFRDNSANVPFLRLTTINGQKKLTFSDNGVDSFPINSAEIQIQAGEGINIDAGVVSLDQDNAFFDQFAKLTDGKVDPNVIPVDILPPTVTERSDVFFPASLTGTTDAVNNFALWDNVVDGSFRITLDGVILDVENIDFTGDTSMADVAATIQESLRTASGTEPTVAWDGDQFVITSSVTTSVSSISTTSATGAGTDISGADAGFRGMATNNGTVQVAERDFDADNGSTVGLEGGYIPSEFIKEENLLTLTSTDAINVAGAPVPVAQPLDNTYRYAISHGSDNTDNSFQRLGTTNANYHLIKRFTIPNILTDTEITLQYILRAADFGNVDVPVSIWSDDNGLPGERLCDEVNNADNFQQTGGGAGLTLLCTLVPKVGGVKVRLTPGTYWLKFRAESLFNGVNDLEGVYESTNSHNDSYYLNIQEDAKSQTTELFISYTLNNPSIPSLVPYDANEPYARNFIGYLHKSVAAGETAEIQVAGVVKNLAGLTPGEKVTLGTEANGGQIIVGTAKNENELILEDRIVIGEKFANLEEDTNATCNFFTLNLGGYDPYNPKSFITTENYSTRVGVDTEKQVMRINNNGSICAFGARMAQFNAVSEGETEYTNQVIHPSRMSTDDRVTQYTASRNKFTYNL